MQDLQGCTTMGRFTVDFIIKNHRDVIAAELGNIPPEQVRRATLRGLVDTGATYLVLPAAVVKQLGLPQNTRMEVRYADGRRATRDVVSEAQLEVAGREGTFRAIVEPKRQDALIGAIVLEDLDLLPDCTNRCLIPRDPNIMVGEIE